MTPQRLPVEGKPHECEQEAAESVVMAEHMSGMPEAVETAEPMVVDVDRMALLGREPAERACGVDNSDE